MQTETQNQNFEAPGRGGFLPEKLLGRTGEDFDSTAYTTMGLDEICLENIVMASLNQDILKKNFEILLNALKMQAQKVAGLSRRFLNYDDLLNEVKEGLFHHDKKLEDMKGLGNQNPLKNDDFKLEKELLIEEIHKLKEKDKEKTIEIADLKEIVKSIESRLSDFNPNKGLEEKVLKTEETLKIQETFSNDLQQRIQDIQANNLGILQKIEALEMKSESFESKMQLIQSLNSGNNNEGPDLTGIINQISMFRRELKDYVLNEDFDTFKTFFSKFSNDLQKPLRKIELLEVDIEKLKVKNQEFDGLRNLIEKASEQTSSLELEIMRQFTDIEEKIAEIQAKIAEIHIKPEEKSNEISPEFKDSINKDLSRKVNIEDYLQILREIETIKENMELLSSQLINMATSIETKGDYKPIMPQPMIQQVSNTKEIGLLKDLSSKVGDLESLIRKMQREFNENSNVFSAKIKENSEGIKSLDEKKLEKSEIKIEKIEELFKKVGIVDLECKALKDHQFSLEKTVGMHEVSIGDILKELAKFKKKNSVGEIPSINKEMVNKLLEEGMKSLRKEIEAFWAQVGLSLNKKSGLDDLWKLESKTLEKLDELVGLFTKKYCDKNETKKAFIYIENKINQLFTAVFGEKEETQEDEALLAKRPLWSCVSCDKELDKYQGKLGEFKGWAQFPPKNTSPERMGKFGTGYMRMIEDRKENNAKDWEKIKNSQMSNQDTTKSVTSYNMFPELPKKKEKKGVF